MELNRQYDWDLNPGLSGSNAYSELLYYTCHSPAGPQCLPSHMTYRCKDIIDIYVSLRCTI